MLRGRGVVTMCGLLASGCGDPSASQEIGDPSASQEIGDPSASQEIVNNLLKVGYGIDDVAIVGDAVYVGNDALVTLEASREMLQAGDSSKEQYRTNNLVSTSLSRICINAPQFNGVFATALDLAIENYNALPLTFNLYRAETPPPGGCEFTITAVIAIGAAGGSAGFPANLEPYSSFIIGTGTGNLPVDTIEHVITHEIGHCFGLRHSDYYNRSISCNTGDDEGDAGVGANHIPGTPTGAVVGGSLMNSCFGDGETGEFTSTDITALTTLYGCPGVPNPPNPIKRVSEQCAGVNNIYWTAQPGATYYELYRSYSSSFTSPTVIYSGPDPTDSINVPQGATWYLRAKACNACGCSDYSSQVSATYYNGTCQ